MHRTIAQVEIDEALVRQFGFFCQSLEAELIAIAGVYKISDDLTPAVRKQRVQVFLKHDELQIEPLK